MDKSIENKEEFDKISELRNTIYNSEDIIDGEYSIGMYGEKYKEIDTIHAKLLETLREYDNLLEKILTGGNSQQLDFDDYLEQRYK